MRNQNDLVLTEEKFLLTFMVGSSIFYLLKIGINIFISQAGIGNGVAFPHLVLWLKTSQTKI